MSTSTSTSGYCRDCAQGGEHGFKLYIVDGNASHWYCCYCGSNHITLTDSEGNTVYEEDDLYDFGG